jgi:hypothetical protein
MHRTLHGAAQLLEDLPAGGVGMVELTRVNLGRGSVNRSLTEPRNETSKEAGSKLPALIRYSSVTSIDEVTRVN